MHLQYHFQLIMLRYTLRALYHSPCKNRRSRLDDIMDYQG